MILPNWRQLSEAAPCRRVGGREMKVGAFVIASELKVLINVIQNLVSCHELGLEDFGGLGGCRR